MKAVTAFLLAICCMAMTNAWTCEEAPRLHSTVKQIDAGNGMVVATDRYHRAYFLTRTNWQYLAANFKHLTVGLAGMWAVSRTNNVYKYVAGHFVQANGITMQQVDAGGNGHLAAVSTNLNTTYCLRSGTARSFKTTSTLSWTNLSSRMKYISCNIYGCWGIDTSSRVYFRQISSSSCSGSWRSISGVGTPKMIETGTNGNVFLLTTNGKVYQRNGVYSSRPYGSSWSLITMCMPINHLTYDLGKLWVVTSGGFLLRCTH